LFLVRHGSHLKHWRQVAAPLGETLAWGTFGSDHQPRLRATERVALARQEYERAFLSHISREAALW